MPVPILGVFAALVAAAGVKKSIDAYDDSEKAKEINSQAKEIIKKATSKTKRARRECNNAISRLGQQKIAVLSGSVDMFFKEFAKLKAIDFNKSDGMDELYKLKFTNEPTKELKEMQALSEAATDGVAAGIAGGALVGLGAYGATGMLACASTGTAISTLGGAAATNATLAWLGGGSLAAGGAGVAGGMAVLGGLVAAPALAIFGLVMSADAAAKKQEAYANLAEAKVYAEEMETAASLCNGIKKRSELFGGLLRTLDEYLICLNGRMSDIISTSGTDYSQFSLDEKKAIASTVAVAVAVKSLLDTPILTKSGKLTKKSETVSNKIAKLVNAKHHSGDISKVYTK